MRETLAARGCGAKHERKGCFKAVRGFPGTTQGRYDRAGSMRSTQTAPAPRSPPFAYATTDSASSSGPGRQPRDRWPTRAAERRRYAPSLLLPSTEVAQDALAPSRLSISAMIFCSRERCGHSIRSASPETAPDTGALQETASSGGAPCRRTGALPVGSWGHDAGHIMDLHLGRPKGPAHRQALADAVPPLLTGVRGTVADTATLQAPPSMEGHGRSSRAVRRSTTVDAMRRGPYCAVQTGNA